MYAQITYFDGPRSEALVAAGERAGRERIIPLVCADPVCAAAHRATFVLRQDDGSEIVLVLADSEAALDRGGELISSSALLPGEDAALLPGPDRSQRMHVVAAYDADYRELVTR